MAMISNPKGGIEVEVFWCDQHMVEYQFRCSNGRFSGVAEIYLNHGDLSNMADSLSGFPSHPKDSRDIELGAFDPNHADGGIRLHFYCLDSVAHAAVDVRLRGDACEALGEVESAALRIPVEAAAVDSFIKQVRGLDPQQIGATACLNMAV